MYFNFIVAFSFFYYIDINILDNMILDNILHKFEYGFSLMYVNQDGF